MKRFAVPLVIVGSLAVLAAAVVLLRAITAESPAAPATTAPPPKADPWANAQPSAPTPSPGISSTGKPLPQVARPSEPDRRAPSTATEPGGLPSLGSDAPPGTRANTKNLHFGLPQLRDKIAASAPKVQACIGGSKPTGEAMLTFIVAQRAGKIVVEQSDYDADKTTLQDEKLIECLHKTALSMQFDGLPREAEAIIVTRAMRLEAGAIAEDTALKFSYMR